jgi:hypothetical protein
MRGPRSGVDGLGGRSAAIVGVPLLLLLLLVPSVLAAPSGGGPNVSRVATTGSDGFYAQAKWDGANVANYTAPTAAARIDFNGVADVDYNWSSRGLLAPATTYTITDARLQIFYFGYALATRDVVDAQAVPATNGSFTLNWTTGALQYVLEGSYKLVASLLASNGTTMWSESFWVFVAAPFYVGALLPIVLILIAIWEVYNVATVGKQAMLGRKSSPPRSGSEGGESSSGGASSAGPGDPPSSGAGT